MKQKLFSISALLILFLFQSCALLKEENSSVAATNIQSRPRFLNGITIETGSNSVSTTQNKSVYNSLNKVDKNSIASEKITIDQLVGTSDTALASFIKSWLGVPYQYGGDTKLGIDCSAFTQALYATVYHVSLLRTAFQQFSASTPVYDPENLKEGDLVFFKIRSRVISHVGVYLSDGYFVQASNHGVVISNLDESYWKRHFYAGGRIQG